MEMPREAVLEEYNRALKQGQREVAELSAQGKPTNPAVLDDILPDGSANAVQDLGVLEIPSQRILGTKSAGRIAAFRDRLFPPAGCQVRVRQQVDEPVRRAPGGRRHPGCHPML